MLLFFGCSGIFWRGAAAPTPQCQGPCTGSGGNHSTHIPSNTNAVYDMICPQAPSFSTRSVGNQSPQFFSCIPTAVVGNTAVWLTQVGIQKQLDHESRTYSHCFGGFLSVLRSSSCSQRVSRPDGKTAADGDANAEVEPKLCGEDRPSWEPSNGMKM